MSTSPSDDELSAALRALRSENPSLGAAKLLSLLIARNPTWAVSEKRVRKALQREGLSTAIPDSVAKEANPDEPLYPTSHLLQSLQLEKLTTQVAVKDFGRKKGKGLVAALPIAEGETIWEEDPVIMNTDWNIELQQRTAQRCMNCTRPLPKPNRAPIPCKCSAMFCDLLCANRGKDAHAFLCPAQNPASEPFLDFVRGEKYKAPYAWARTTALIITLWQKGADGAKQLEEVLDFVHGLAGLSLDQRIKALPNWKANIDTYQTLWRRSYDAFLRTFKTPQSSTETKALNKLLKGRVLSPELDQLLFGWDGFLLGLGKMSLNMEAHGGLYPLHSHINHDCSPNISARHLSPLAIPHLTLVARRAIQPNEELTITYVNPELDVRARRRELKEWGFGLCMCQRCIGEEKEAPKEEAGAPGGPNKGELEDELRGFLGF